MADTIKLRDAAERHMGTKILASAEVRLKGSGLFTASGLLLAFEGALVFVKIGLFGSGAMTTIRSSDVTAIDHDGTQLQVGLGPRTLQITASDSERLTALLAAAGLLPGSPDEPEEPAPLPAPAAEIPEPQKALNEALIEAAESDDEEEAADLLAQGADANAADAGGGTALMAACEGGHELVMLLVEQGADVNAVNASGETPLLIAAANCNAETVELLLQHGADPAVHDDDGDTALLHAVYNGGRTLAPLLALGQLDLEECNQKGETPLIIAAMWGGIDSLRALLAAGASTEIDDNLGKNAEDHAREQDDPLLLKIILSAGTTEDEIDATLARRRLNMELLWATNGSSLDEVKTAVQRGADLSARDSSGETVLHNASSNSVAIVRWLVEQGVDVNESLDDGRTALMAAARYGDVETIQVLLQAGAGIDARDRDGYTPLMCAADEGSVENAAELINQGADVTARNKRGEDALTLAVDEEEAAVVALLKRHQS